MSNPVSYDERRTRILQLVPDYRGEDHVAKQGWENIDVPNEKKIIDRTSIGDDQHQSESQPSQVLALMLKVLDSVVRPDLMSFQEPVELITSGEPQKSTQVSLADVADPVFLQCESFERSTREVAPSAEAFYEIVGNMHAYVHMAPL